MKDLRNKESKIIDEFKYVILLDKEGLPSEVPVIYASPDNVLQYLIAPSSSDSGSLFEFAKGAEALQLPVIGLNTITVGHNHFSMEGVVYTLYQNDLSQIIEQFHHTIEDLNNNITIGNVHISHRFISPRGGVPNVNVCIGEFVVEYRE